jgi:hypothetical protein
MSATHAKAAWGGGSCEEASMHRGCWGCSARHVCQGNRRGAELKRGIHGDRRELQAEYYICPQECSTGYTYVFDDGLDCSIMTWNDFGTLKSQAKCEMRLRCMRSQVFSTECI